MAGKYSYTRHVFTKLPEKQIQIHIHNSYNTIAVFRFVNYDVKCVLAIIYINIHIIQLDIIIEKTPISKYSMFIDRYS